MSLNYKYNTIQKRRNSKYMKMPSLLRLSQKIALFKFHENQIPE